MLRLTLEYRIFLLFFGEYVLLSNIMEKNWQIFMQLSAKVGYDTMKKLKHFDDVVFNPLDSGSFWISVC